MAELGLFLRRQDAMAALDQAGADLEVAWLAAESGSPAAVAAWLVALKEFRHRLDVAQRAELDAAGFSNSEGAGYVM